MVRAMTLFPDMFSLLEVGILIVSSFLSSFLSAAVGLGGGVTMLAVIAQILPAPAIVPVHGIIQLGSNIGRSFLLRKYIDYKTIGIFAVGSIIGALVGGNIVVALNAALLQMILGLFVLYSCWGPKPSPKAASKYAVLIGGAISTTLTMFLGATGPFVAALLKPKGYKRETQVSTMSASMVVQHTLKLGVFGLLGFAYGPYIGLMAAMVTAGFIGTYLGRKLLFKTSDKTFGIALNIILTLLALRLLWVGLSSYLN